METDLVVVGASLGGLNAIKSIISTLPKGFAKAIVIVQHRKAGDDLLTELLQNECVLKVNEAEDKMMIQAGNVYLAPADYHLLVENDHLALSTAAPVKYARPSIDLLFESAAVAYGSHAIGILLTGSNEDGAAGLAAIRSRGGLALAQDPKTAESPTMPAAAIKIKAVDKILPLNEIGQFIVNLTDRTRDGS